MKVIIAGSRDITDYDLVCRAVIASGFEITEVVSGECRGVDKLGERWARSHGIKIEPFAYLRKLGSRGGPVRNEQMAKYADALIAIPRAGKSDGTDDMIRRAKVWNRLIFIHNEAVGE